MKIHHFLLLAALLITPLVPMTLAPDYPSLPDSLSSPSFSYTVHYEDDNPYNPASPGPSPDLDYMPAAQAQRIVDACNNSAAAAPGNPNGMQVGFSNLGFDEPEFFGTSRNLYSYNCSDCDSGGATADAILMPSTLYISASEQCIRAVTGHELFHHVQMAYFGTSWGSWLHPAEGTARMMQDKIYNDLDAWNGSGCCCGYVGELNGILSSPNNVLWDLTYPSALWWTYLAEQLGTTTAEPYAGADFIQQLWVRIEANNNPPDLVKTVREAIAHFTSASLEALFQDFTVANYTKQMDLSLLSQPQDYRYRDENDGNGLTFGSVGMTWTGSPPQTASSDVVRWGARYFEANVSGCGEGVVGFHSTGGRTGYSLVPIKGIDDVQAVFKASSVDNYSKAFLQRSASPYSKLGVVVTGGDLAASYTYTFDCGKATLTIREPFHPDPIAYVGKHNEPEPFLIKLRVVGPATLGSPSVEGLENSDFTVFVGDPDDPENEAEVLSGAYVQGDYWLVAQAPEKPSATPEMYNLTVDLGKIAAATNEGAVVYAKKTVDQILVIDRSGSMLSPALSSKIKAAKMAGKLFVDSARSDDYTGVVSFSGDRYEPNDDSKLDFALNPVTPDSRIDAKKAIDSIVTQDMTSIGDGLNRAYTEIVLSGHGRPSPPAERWIVLLSDGMENEPFYWSAVQDTIKNNEIKVNAIALGPLSDQPLMQSIAEYTGGRYYYVDLPPTMARSAGSGATFDAGTTLDAGEHEAVEAPDAAPQLPLMLGDVFALSAERIQSHERLWESSGSIDAGERLLLSLNVKEGGIVDPLFTYAWSGGELVDFDLEDPSGHTLGDIPDAEVYYDDYHVTIRLPYLEPGEWRISLEAGASTPSYLVSLSGINRLGAQLRLFFGAYGGDLDGFPTNQFPIGKPMPIIASLTDIKGPVLGARVRAAVEHPDGTKMTLPLYDDGSHNDNLAGDGIFGGFYYRTTQGSKSHQTDTVYNRRGSYNVTVEAEGEDNYAEYFQRVAKGSFSVIVPREAGGDFQDSDKDGLTDLYEKLHPCMSYLVSDSDLDPDLDGLTNLDEFSFGTDPCSGDSDNGGENDGSEIEFGKKPLDQGDDDLPPPIDVGVIKQLSHDLGDPGLKPNANLIRYPASKEYEIIRLFRRMNLSQPFELLIEFGAQYYKGLYLDEGLTPGVEYSYRLVGVNSAGAQSAPSGEFRGTPSANPVPPVGGITINNHARFVTSNLVKLHLPLNLAFTTAKERSAYEAGMSMLIANNPKFSDAKWQVYSQDPNWTLAPDGSGHAIVFVKFMDDFGNQSEVYHAEVDVRPSQTLGSIHLRVWLDTRLFRESTRQMMFPGPIIQPAAITDPAAITLPGAIVLAEDEPLLPPAFTDENGFATLGNLPPGFYRLFIQYPGWQPLLTQQIQVLGGETVELSSQTLIPWLVFMPLTLK